MPLRRRGAAGAPEQGHDVQRFINDLGAVFFGDFLKLVARKVGVGRNRRKVVVNFGHNALFRSVVVWQDRNWVISGVNVTIL